LPAPAVGLHFLPPLPSSHEDSRSPTTDVLAMASSSPPPPPPPGRLPRLGHPMSGAVGNGKGLSLRLCWRGRSWACMCRLASAIWRMSASFGQTKWLRWGGWKQLVVSALGGQGSTGGSRSASFFEKRRRCAPSGDLGMEITQQKALKSLSINFIKSVGLCRILYAYRDSPTPHLRLRARYRAAHMLSTWPAVANG